MLQYPSPVMCIDPILIKLCYGTVSRMLLSYLTHGERKNYDCDLDGIFLQRTCVFITLSREAFCPRFYLNNHQKFKLKMTELCNECILTIKQLTYKSLQLTICYKCIVILISIHLHQNLEKLNGTHVLQTLVLFQHVTSLSFIVQVLLISFSVYRALLVLLSSTLVRLLRALRIHIRSLRALSYNSSELRLSFSTQSWTCNKKNLFFQVFCLMSPFVTFCGSLALQLSLFSLRRWDGDFEPFPLWNQKC